ncbi:Rad52/Rad22 family DNA repair protein [Anthocerotibacter panamensis]|uniref:Rad52/Rad22 family DNA repair protein n=1 Tax=Anthocerotibacter panamensis TaxID=2857077 RepID=UPI001C4044D9|nr:Rad52/Rad22 family DNA repair protein [Anthocerotibacter panamensis]
MNELPTPERPRPTSLPKRTVSPSPGTTHPTQGLAQEFPPGPARMRLFAKIMADLAKPIPPRLIRTRQQDGATIPYIPWHTVNHLLDHYAPGWEGQITEVCFSNDRIYVVYALTIHASDCSVTRMATGTELLKGTDRQGKPREVAFGDPSSNAESQAFRRAAARFNLGLHLYEKGSG